MTALLEVFWKSGAVLGAALCITLLLRKRSADTRRLILSATIVAMFLAAAAAPLLPRLNVTEPRWFAPRPTPPVMILTPSGDSSAAIVRTPVPQSASTPAVSRVPFSEFIPLLWFAGVLLFLTRLALGLYGLRRMRRAAHPISGDPRLLQSDSIAAPVTWGVIHPVILVPAGFEYLPDESREAVLCHELAHIHSYDFLLRMLAEIGRALIWFQPLMWLVTRRLREEQELACDDRVLASGVKPSAYAKLLLDWDLTPATPAIGMAAGGCLKRRLYALLNRDTDRGRITSALVFTTGILALAAALPLAAMNWTRPADPVPAQKLRKPEPAEPTQPTATLIAQAKSVLLAQAQPTRVPLRAPAAMFVSSTMLVQVDVAVTNRNDGQPLVGLTAGDFEVAEDGKPMSIVNSEFEPVLSQTESNGLKVTSYYVLGYYTKNLKSDEAWRSVKVSLKNSDAKLDYRAGYFGPSTIPAVTYEPRTMPAGIAPPALMSKVEPAYSEQARRAKFSGTVTLDAVVNESGKPEDIRVRQPLGFGLDENAIEALAKWRFRPAIQNGEPTRAEIRVEMGFYVL
ncbi:MAG TPA: TonB family protein [Bryobacteraceae bacterium]|nr:TonB family protein [Bryobacteraceae bacterium]